MVLVTQTLDELPTVAVVGEESPLRRLVVEVVKESHLRPQTFSPNNSAALAQEVLSLQPYKIVLLPGKYELEELTQRLHQEGQATLVIWPFATQTQAGAAEELGKQLQNLPGDWCGLQDLTDGEVALPVWTQTSSQLGEGNVSQGEGEWRPQTLAAVKTGLSRILISRWQGQRWVIRGAARQVSQTAKAAQQYYQQRTKNLAKIVPGGWQALDPVTHLNAENITFVTSPSQPLDQVLHHMLQRVTLVQPSPTTHSDLPRPRLYMEPPKPKPQPVAPAPQSARPVPPKPEVARPPVVPTPARGESSPSTPPRPVTLRPAVRPLAPSRQERPAEPSTLAADQVMNQTLQQLFAEKQVDRKVSRVQKIAQQQRVFQKKSKRRRGAFLIGMVFAGIGMGVLVLWGILQGSTFMLQRQLSNSIDSPWLSRWATVVSAQVNSYQILLDEAWLEPGATLAAASHQVIAAQKALDTTDTQIQQAYRQTAGSESGDSLATWHAAATRTHELYSQLSQLQLKLEELNQDAQSDPKLKAQLKYLSEWLQAQRRSQVVFQQVEPLLTHILGGQGKRTYAVLLQNHQELRPTGGFLQAIAFVTLDQGVIIDYKVYSVYELEKQFAGQVTPPADLKRYLNEQQLFLHDANWHGDFPTTAQQLKVYLERVQPQPVDGVIGLNLLTLRELIKAMGPLEIPEYNEVLTDKNLLERAEFHSEINVNQGDNQKEYLTVLLQRTLQQLSAIPPEKVGPVLGSLQHAADHQQLQLSFGDLGLQSSIQALGWAGEIVQPPCPTQLTTEQCFVDPMYQVESNVGVNKANQYIKRQIDHTIALTKTGVQHQRHIIWENTATTQAWPRGTYKGYVRLYLPADAQQVQVMINNQPLVATNITQTIENSRLVVGFLAEVPIQQRLDAVVSYTRSAKLDGPFAYAFFDQKQPGTESDPLTITLTHDQQFRPTLIAPQADVKPGRVIFATTKSENQFVGVAFE